MRRRRSRSAPRPTRTRTSRSTSGRISPPASRRRSGSPSTFATRAARPDRPVRISHSLVSFAAWAVATPSTPGAVVDVRFPDGYSVTVRARPARRARSPTRPATRSGRAESSRRRSSSWPTSLPTDQRSTSRRATTVPHGGGSRHRARPGMAGRRGLARSCRLACRAGAADPRARDRGAVADRGPLAVREALVRSTGGYAGVFDPAVGTIEIAYSASDGVILHELAHAWFNGSARRRSLGCRGVRRVLRGAGRARELASIPAAPALPAEPSDAAIPLNAWGPARERGPGDRRRGPTRPRSSSPARSPGAPGPRRCARSGPRRRAGSARTSR